MPQQLYRVVEAVCGAGGRVEKDIGCQWKPEPKAKEELKQLKLKRPSATYSLQKQSRP